MTRRFPLRTEARALGAVQIVLALFHYTLGFLCAVLFLGEEDVKTTGSVPVLLTLGYIIWSSPFFLISGCMAIIAQKKPTRYQLTSAIVMNIFSACFSAFGTIILCIACLSYVAEMEDYVWSQLAGGMLLQYLLFSSVTELIIVSILLCWIVRALKQSEPKKEIFCVCVNVTVFCYKLKMQKTNQSFTGDGNDTVSIRMPSAAAVTPPNPVI